MGFGSYDESEQTNQQGDSDFDEDDAVNVHESEHEGESTFDPGASNSELLDKLQGMKSEEDDAQSD